MQVADLISDGGYLQDEQANRFVQDVIKEAVMLKMVDVRGLKSHTQIMDKIGINGRVLRPGTSGQALAAGDRVKPTTDQVELSTHLLKGEIRLTDEIIEDNIEGGTFKTTVMSMMSEHVALDMDDLLVNGDVTSDDQLLAVLDGMIVTATSHVVNGGTVPINKAMLKAAVKAMPSQYNKGKSKHRMLTSDDAETDYRDYLSDRATVLGDKFMLEDAPIRYSGRPILGIPVFPDNLGIATDCTNILLTDPKNARWGIWRKVKVETDRDITTGEWIMVVTVRCGFKWRETDAVVKVTNVKTQ